MKLLIIGNNSRFFHLKEFGEELKKNGEQYKLIYDVNFLASFFNFTRKNRKCNEFRRVLNDFKPDIVLLDRLSNIALPVLKAAIPLVLLLRGNYWEEARSSKETVYNSPQKRFYFFMKQRFVDKCFRESTLILPISKYLDGIVRERYPNKSIKMLYADGRNPSDWYPQKGMNLKHPCVGLLQGANIWEKTKEMLTLAKVLEAMPNVMFYWAGDGPYRDQILPVLKKYDNFKWLGSLQYPDQVRQFLTEIDVYALVSGLEGLGQTIIEASLMKKPVVATNVGGIPELIEDDKTGFLVDKGDYDSWIRKLSILITDNEKASEMSRKNYNFIKDNFSWETIARKFCELIKPYSKLE
jgi:glycosyltransferase involved in cell wall biosynthesis